MNTADVVVIGSGPGGAAAAWSLASSGIKVRMLEAGPRYNPLEDYLIDQPIWERTQFPEKLQHRDRQTSASLQELDPGEEDLRSWNRIRGRLLPGSTRRFMTYSHVVGVGGSTLHYAGESHRLNPNAMQMKTRFGVAADWPFDYLVLEPYYQQAERLIGVAGPTTDPTRPRNAPYPMQAHAMSYATQKLGKGCEKMGLSWIPNPLAAASRPYDGRPPCNYCGQCGRGCPRLDKGTADITLINKALNTGNLELTTNAQVLRLETGPGSKVSSVIFADKSGGEHRLEAEAFVVACGAIETPRLLLNSHSSHAPEGLANESGMVGRNFMETLFWKSIALHPDALASYRGLPSDAICWDFNAPDSIPGVIGGARFSPGVLEANLGGPLEYARRVVGGWGHEHHKLMRDTFGKAIAIGAIGENLPNPKSFVDLDPEATDAFAMSKARIHSFLPEMEIQRLKFMRKICREILEAAGTTEFVEEYGSYDMFAASHVFGTCRMGTDPGESVVDADCRSHRWRNLLITDASVFPSSGGGEGPSLTIYANALRAVEKLARAHVH